METNTGQSWAGLAIFSIGMYFIHNQPPAWDVVLLGGGSWVIGVGLIAQNQIARLIEQKSMYDPPKPAIQEKKEEKLITGGNIQAEMPVASGLKKLTPVMLDFQYESESEFPKINNEAMVARTLIQQRNSNLEENLTEAFWVRTGRFPESREKFAAMLRRWRYHGVIDKKSMIRNSKFIVKDWQTMRAIANGRILPPPPKDYKP